MAEWPTFKDEVIKDIEANGAAAAENLRQDDAAGLPKGVVDRALADYEKTHGGGWSESSFARSSDYDLMGVIGGISEQDEEPPYDAEYRQAAEDELNRRRKARAAAKVAAPAGGQIVRPYKSPMDETKPLGSRENPVVKGASSQAGIQAVKDRIGDPTNF